MAKFLTTAGIASNIEEIIRKSTTYCVIVTPYLKLSMHVEQRIKDANQRKVQLTIIYGKTELTPKETQKLKKLNHLELFYCPNLHAKCYHNEHSMVISSMNLHEFSEKNNREMGVLLTRNEDGELFNDALSEIESIKNASRILKDRLFAPHIENPYVNLTDFQLPLILRMLQAEFPDKVFMLEKDMIKCDFRPGLRLHIDNRVIYRFDIIKECSEFKTNITQNTTFANRCFWGDKTLHFYLPKGYQPKLTEDGQEDIADYLFNFIKETIPFI